MNACSACGSCGFGCTAGTKRAGGRLHLGAAAAGGVRLLAGAHADRIIIEGGVATSITGSVRAVDGTARSFTVRVPRAIVAAGALRTPVLLARSGVRHAGLGVGLRLQPATLLFARMGSIVGAWSGPLAGARVQRTGGVGVATVPLHPGSLAAALPWQRHDPRMTAAAAIVPLRSRHDPRSGRRSPGHGP